MLCATISPHGLHVARRAGRGGRRSRVASLGLVSSRSEKHDEFQSVYFIFISARGDLDRHVKTGGWELFEDNEQPRATLRNLHTRLRCLP